MTVAEIALSLEPGRGEHVFLWRLETLRDAGFGVAAACELAARRDVDLHRAVALVAGGCPPETAARILR